MISVGNLSLNVLLTVNFSFCVPLSMVSVYEQMLEETIRNLQEDNMRLRLEIDMQVEIQRQVACQVQEHMQQRELEANAREEAREWEWQQQMECQLEEHMQQRELEANAREWEWQQKMNDINSMLRDNYDPRPPQ
nr:hypothetical protein [Tanacetum cinerariifolium]